MDVVTIYLLILQILPHSHEDVASMKCDVYEKKLDNGGICKEGGVHISNHILWIGCREQGL